jgi:branched-chain amino acid transport system permease protein
MRIPNLMHGSFFMLGAYFGVTLLNLPAFFPDGDFGRDLCLGEHGREFCAAVLAVGSNFWVAVLASALAMALIGAGVERFLLRRLSGEHLAQVLLTLGLSFIVSDLCLMIWTGDPWQPKAPPELRGVVRSGTMIFPLYRLAVVAIAVAVAAALWILVDWTRLGAMIRAGVDDAPIARITGIRVSRLFTLVFALGAALAAFAGVVGAPILSVYPGLDADMLPLALIVVILGGTGSLPGALVGSFLMGFLYNFGQAKFPDLAYVILFLPMVLVLVLRPQGLFGKGGA